MFFSCGAKPPDKIYTSKTFHENGQIKHVLTYKNSILEGPYTEYYKNGQIKSSGNYLNDLKSGNWLTYFKTGELEQSQDYYKGKLNEFCHSKGYDEPVYTLVKKTGLNYNIKFSVNLLVNGKNYVGSGHRIKTAEINSAKKALIDLLGF